MAYPLKEIDFPSTDFFIESFLDARNRYKKANHIISGMNLKLSGINKPAMHIEITRFIRKLIRDNITDPKKIAEMYSRLRNSLKRERHKNLTKMETRKIKAKRTDYIDTVIEFMFEITPNKFDADAVVKEINRKLKIERLYVMSKEMKKVIIDAVNTATWDKNIIRKRLYRASATTKGISEDPTPEINEQATDKFNAIKQGIAQFGQHHIQY